ncbi:hypothetical protein [Pedobacter sp. NJ-S-72]
MKPYSKPVIRKSDPNKWYIDWNHKVPLELRQEFPKLFPRSTKRIKKYGDINLYDGEIREKNAEDLRADWEFCLKHFNYDPFEEIISKLKEVEKLEAEADKLDSVQEELLEEDKRKLLPITRAFDFFLESREARTGNGNTMSTWRGTIKWLTSYFTEKERINDPINSVRRIEIANAVNQAKKNREWENTTYNNEVSNAMTVFNWLATEEYMLKNPAKATIEKIKAKVSKHEWYRREELNSLRVSLLENNCLPVYRAMQFTYHLCIRSKIELMKLKVSDIDTELMRIRFSADLSKDNEECYRDYSPEFGAILEEMNWNSLPSNFYVFGRRGEPSESLNVTKTF